MKETNFGNTRQGNLKKQEIEHKAIPVFNKMLKHRGHALQIGNNELMHDSTGDNKVMEGLAKNGSEKAASLFVKLLSEDTEQE